MSRQVLQVRSGVALEGEGLGGVDQGQSGQHGQGAQEKLDEQSRPRPVDDHQIWSEADSTPECLAEQAVRDMVREAHRKAHGEVPEEISELVEGWLAPPVIPWQQEFNTTELSPPLC